MDTDVKRIGRELIHKGHIIDYYEDTMELPNGHTAKWDLIDHRGAAAVVPVLDDGRILMVSQYRNTCERTTLEIPAGGLEPGEDTKTAAARELEEETGYTSDNITLLLSIYTTVAFCNEKIDIYVARDLKKTHQHLDEDEFLNVGAYELEDLVQMVKGCKIQDSKTVGAILAVREFIISNTN